MTENQKVIVIAAFNPRTLQDKINEFISNSKINAISISAVHDRVVILYEETE